MRDGHWRILTKVRRVSKHFLKLASTVKAPNFDRVFTKNIFFLNIFYRWHTLEKLDRMYKIRDFVMSKSKFWLVDYTVPQKNFSQGVEVTSWAANFDRYIHFLKIMAAREKCMTLGTCLSLKTVWREFPSCNCLIIWTISLQECSLFFLIKAKNTKSH